MPRVSCNRKLLLIMLAVAEKCHYCTYTVSCSTGCSIRQILVSAHDNSTACKNVIAKILLFLTIDHFLPFTNVPGPLPLPWADVRYFQGWRMCFDSCTVPTLCRKCCSNCSEILCCFYIMIEEGNPTYWTCECTQSFAFHSIHNHHQVNVYFDYCTVLSLRIPVPREESLANITNQIETYVKKYRYLFIIPKEIWQYHLQCYYAAVLGLDTLNTFTVW